MKRQRVLGIEFLAGRRRFARATDGAVEGWPMGGRRDPTGEQDHGLTAMIFVGILSDELDAADEPSAFAPRAP
jgi:hypothetical protein